MTRIFLIFILIIPQFVKSQTPAIEFPYQDGKIVYERIVDIPGTSKDLLFKSAKIWFVENFKDSRAVIKSEDKESGEILGTGRTNVVLAQSSMFITSMDFVFDIRVSVRDNRYRIQIYNIEWDIEKPGTFLTNRKLENIDKLTVNIDNLNTKQLAKKERDTRAISGWFYGLIEKFKEGVVKGKKDDF